MGVGNGRDPVSDVKELRERRDEIADHSQKIDQAEQQNDVTNAELLRQELANHLAYLKQVTCPAGRLRWFKTEIERARRRVYASLRGAYKDLRPSMPKTARHLETFISIESRAFI
jgi:hypothetical protein